MKKCRVTFLPAHKSVEVAAGSTIAQAAQRAEIHINNLCGGEGVCGECKVQVLKGVVKTGAGPSAFFSKEEREKGFVLACQSKITEDLEVEIPPESRLEGEQIMTGEAASDVQGGVSPERMPETPFYPLKPLVRKIYLELPPPTLQDNITDIERVSRELRKKIG
jgi:uncharacterized 2Fe-2S/4Fe-4S cluster protein (DUF4445 family)